MGTTEQVMHTEAAAATGLVALLRRRAWLRWPGAFGLGALVGGLFSALVSALLVLGIVLFVKEDSIGFITLREIFGAAAVLCVPYGAFLGGALFIAARGCRVPYRYPILGAATGGFMVGVVPLWCNQGGLDTLAWSYFAAIYGSLTGGAVWIAAAAQWEDWQRRQASAVEEIAARADDDGASLAKTLPKPSSLVLRLAAMYLAGAALGAALAVPTVLALIPAAFFMDGEFTWHPRALGVSAVWGAQLGGALVVVAAAARVRMAWPLITAVVGALVLGVIVGAADEPLQLLAGVFGSLLGGFIGVTWAAVRRRCAEVNPLTLQNLHKTDAG